MAIDFQPQSESTLDFQPETPISAGGMNQTTIPAMKEAAKQAVGLYGQQIKGSIEEVKNLAQGIPGAAIKGSQFLSGDIASAIPSTEEAKSLYSNMGQSLLDALKHPLDTLSKNKLGVASMFMVPTSEGANFSKSTSSFLSNAGERIKGIFKEAPTAGEIESGVQNVQNALKRVISERGELLNTAKREVGLPITPEEKVKALKETGNQFNFNQEDQASINKAFGEKFGGVSGHMPDMLTEFADKAMKANPKDLYTYISNRVDDVTLGTEKGELLPSGKQWFKSVSGRTELSPETAYFKDRQVADQFKQEVMIKLKDMSSFLKPENIKSPEDLSIAIDNFKTYSPMMGETTRVKLASLLQDKISNFVDYSKPGDSLQGVLKTQGRDLRNIGIPDSLKGSKAQMKEALDLMDDLGKKLEDPGKSEAFLRRLFTSKNAANKDYLNSLARLETMSGEPVLSNLFELFQKEANSTISSHTLQHPISTAIKTVLPYAVDSLKVTPSLAKKAAVLSGFQQLKDNTVLQSLKDRLNAKNRTKTN